VTEAPPDPGDPDHRQSAFDDRHDDESSPSRVQRGRARVDAARDGAAEVAERLVAARPETPLIDAGFELYERDSRIAGGMLAGAVAFRLFLLVVPLLLILVAGLGFLHASGTERSASTELGFSQTLVSTMSTVGQNAERGRWVTLWVGLVAAVFAVRTMIKSLRIVHNLAWGTTRKPSANRPVDLVVGVGIVTLVVVMAGSSQWIRARTPGGGLLASIAVAAIAAALYLVVELVLPKAEGASWVRLVPGAILVGVGMQLLHGVTVFYFAGRISRMSQTYGPLGVAIVALLWLYILGRMMVGAAVLNATLWDREQRGERTWVRISRDLLRRP